MNRVKDAILKQLMILEQNKHIDCTVMTDSK